MFGSGTRAVVLRNEYKRLHDECCRCSSCGHVQAEPSECHICGSRLELPPWAEQMAGAQRRARLLEEEVASGQLVPQDQLRQAREAMGQARHALGAEYELVRQTANHAIKLGVDPSEMEPYKDRALDIRRAAN